DEMGGAEGFPPGRIIATPDPKNSPPVGEDVRQGEVLGEREGMPHSEDIEAAAEFEALGMLGKPQAPHEEVRDTLVPFALEMVLGRPEDVIAQLIHELGDLLRNVKGACKALVRIPALVGRRPSKADTIALQHMSGIQDRKILNHRFSLPPHVRAVGAMPRSGKPASQSLVIQTK